MHLSYKRLFISEYLSKNCALVLGVCTIFPDMVNRGGMHYISGRREYKVFNLNDTFPLENEADCLRMVTRNQAKYEYRPIELFVEISPELKKDEEKYVISKVCSECCGPITGFIYVCVQCPDHYLCSTCDTNGKHPEHPIIRLKTAYPTVILTSLFVRALIAYHDV